MSFLNPTLALVGLASIALPILIHLLIRRRVKPVRWAAMKFLLEAYKQRRRRLILEQLLLLATRCLLVACVAIALGRLLMGGPGLAAPSRPTTLVLILDDSLTARAGDAFERHKTAAAALLAQLNPGAGDTAALITLSSPAEGPVVPATSDLGSLRSVIDRLTPTDARADMPGALALVGQTRRAADEAASPRTVLAILSDFHAGSADIQSTLAPLDPAPDLVLLSPARPEGLDNVAVVGVEPFRSVVTGGRAVASTNQVRVTLRRFGPTAGSPRVARVNLLAPDDDGRLAIAATQEARFEAGQSDASLVMPLQLVEPDARSHASQIIGASIEPDALPADDVLRAVVEFRPSIRIAVVAPRRFRQAGGIDQFDPADWATLALEPAAPSGPGDTRPDLETTRLEPSAITAPRLAGFDAVVLCVPHSLDATAWEAIRAHVAGGGLLFVIPPHDQTVHLWADNLASTFGLPWQIDREARVPERPLLIEPAPRETRAGDLLRLVDAELPELARAVQVHRTLGISPGENTDAVQLALGDGSPLLIADRPPAASRGLVALLSTSLNLEWTDLPAKPLVVPLMQEVIRQGVGRARGTWTSIAGAAPAVPPGTAELRPDRISERDDALLAMQVTANAPSPVRRAGIYRALDERGVTRAVLAVRPDPLASDTSPIAAPVIAGWLAGAVGTAPMTTIDQAASGPESDGANLRLALRGSADLPDASLPFLIAALALAVIELALARWSSHARRLSPGIGSAAA